MQRIALNSINHAPHFIGAWSLESLKLCDELVAYFESDRGRHKKGMTFGGVNENVKKSIDITILPYEVNLPQNEVLKRYVEALFACHQDYLLQWPFLGGIANKLEIGSFNIQRYQAGEHFQKIHTERANLATLHRILAWMTYLNDVGEGGSTYFSHYDLEVKPRKGLTLIWPAEWTHAHKGNVLHTGSKYIITGWLDFCE